MGILGDRSLGPIVLTKRIRGAVYHRFSVNDLSVLLEQVPLHQQQNTWFMHDGARTHFLHIVRKHLNQTFGELLVACEGLVYWPARYPDLNILDLDCGDTWKFGIFSTDKLPRDTTAKNMESFSKDSIDTRNILQITHLIAIKSWK
jgi:hypothetical protein